MTVVVPTYKRTERLEACLAGVRSQHRPADEVVVVVHTSDEASARVVAQLASRWPALRSTPVVHHGVVAAYNRGLESARGEIVAYVDDDAVPSEDWLRRIVETFAQDERIGAVGGRDVIFTNGRLFRGGSRRRRRAPAVGRLQWFGRMIGNHHLGEGPPRDVDILKGANMSFRRSAMPKGFDPRLRGFGAEFHSELSVCLPMRRRGLRVVYDPSVVVLHYPAPRHYGDQRDSVDRDSVAASAHNEALLILDHFGPMRRLVYAVWGFLIGHTDAPGLAIVVRDRLVRRPEAWSRFVAAQRGRAAAIRTRRNSRTGTAVPSDRRSPDGHNRPDRA